jgi:hypothetical protein
MPRSAFTTHVVKTENQTVMVSAASLMNLQPMASSMAPSSNSMVMWPNSMAQIIESAANSVSKHDPDFSPATPTSMTSRPPNMNNIVVTPSSSGGNRRGTAAAFAIVKQEGTNRLIAKPNSLVKQPMTFVTTSSSSSSSVMVSATSDHEYGQYSTPVQQKRTIYLTPSSSGLGSSGGGGPRSIGPASVVMHSVHSGSVVVGGGGQVKSEARRKLNLDAAALNVDPEGFKTPIKSAKRRAQDLSSPSPKKSELVKKKTNT